MQIYFLTLAFNLLLVPSMALSASQAFLASFEAASKNTQADKAVVEKMQDELRSLKIVTKTENGEPVGRFENTSEIKRALEYLSEPVATIEALVEGQ